MSTLRGLLIIIRYRPWFFLANCLAWGIFHSLPLVTALLIREIFDLLAGEAGIGMNVWTLLTLVVVTSLSRVSVMVGAVWLWSTAYYTFTALLRRNLFDWIMTGPGTRPLPDSPGEAVTRFRDDVHEVLLSLENWTDFTGIFVSIVGGVFIMAQVDPLLTVVAMAPLVGVFIFGYAVGDRIQAYRRATLEATGTITSFIGEVFGGVQAVKVAAAEKDVIRHFEHLNEQRLGVAVRDVLFNSLFRAVNTNMGFVGMGLVMLMVAESMRGGTFNVGDFALFTFFLQRLSWNMFFVGDMIAQHRRTGVSFERLHELVPDAPRRKIVVTSPLYLNGDPPEVVIPEKVMKDRLKRLEVIGLTAIHPSTGRGVRDISFTMNEGEFVVVTGRIGSGKTTLLRGLLGLMQTQAGTIFWNGSAVEDSSSFMTPPRVAYTSQTPRLFSDTLNDNILMGQREKDGGVLEAVNLAVMEPDIELLERGLETKVGPRGVKLSGGQVQRSSAARMFVRDAELLVIDDLSSALDVETESILWDRLFTQRDTSCLVASHRRAALQRADRIILLEQGEIVDIGSLNDLLKRSERMRDLWDDEGSSDLLDS